MFPAGFLKRIQVELKEYMMLGYAVRRVARDDFHIEPIATGNPEWGYWVWHDSKTIFLVKCWKNTPVVDG